MSTVLDINVTPDDIRRGIPRDALACPIGLAVRRTIGGEGDCVVLVDNESVFLLGSSSSLVAALPISAVEFTRKFDDDNKVYPFDFTIELTEELT
jgi:hypothetical protein